MDVSSALHTYAHTRESFTPTGGEKKGESRGEKIEEKKKQETTLIKWSSAKGEREENELGTSFYGLCIYVSFSMPMPRPMMQFCV